MTLSDIAGWLRLSWDTVKAVVKGRLEKDYRRIGYRRVRQIAIDELYLGRTRKYITLVMDMESARIIWVGEGRGAEALREFWRRFKLSGARLKAVAMDMSGAYAASVRAHAPHAILTFDHFHVMKLMNERLDDLRRELARETQNPTAKEAIKGLRWLLLHRRDNLEKDAASRLERSLEKKGAEHEEESIQNQRSGREFGLKGRGWPARRRDWWRGLELACASSNVVRWQGEPFCRGNLYPCPFDSVRAIFSAYSGRSLPLRVVRLTFPSLVCHAVRPCRNLYPVGWPSSLDGLSLGHATDRKSLVARRALAGSLKPKSARLYGRRVTKVGLEVDPRAPKS